VKDGCTCARCCGIYRVDLIVSDDLWSQIFAGAYSARLLCGRCIIDGLEGRQRHDAFYLTSHLDRARPAPGDRPKGAG